MTKAQLHKVIGENIKIQRIRHGMTQSDLAEFLDIQLGSLALMERGSRGTTIYTLFKLSNIFGLSVDVFFIQQF